MRPVWDSHIINIEGKFFSFSQMTILRTLFNRYGFAFFRFTAGCFPIFFNISLKAEYTKKETSGFTGLLRSTKFVGYSKQYKVKILNKIRKYVILKTVRTIDDRS